MHLLQQQDPDTSGRREHRGTSPGRPRAGAGAPLRILSVVALAAAGGCAAASAAPVVPGLIHHGAADDALAGTILLGELNCVACHEAGAFADTVEAKPAPNLASAGARIRPGYLARFIAAPHEAKPGTTMPDILGHLPDDERLATAAALAEYLRSIAPAFDPEIATETPEGGMTDGAARGEETFHTAGCVACHDPRGTASAALAGSVPLGDPSAKYRFAGLVAFLEDPLAVRPGGRMPDLNLDHWEALDMAAFLTGGAGRPDATDPTPPVDGKLAEEGARQFARLGCASCHDDGQVHEAPTPAPPLSSVRPDHGCLAVHDGPNPESHPRFSLAGGQLRALRGVLASPPEQPDVHRRIETILTRFSCFACHARDGHGGISGERDPYFTSDNLNLGEQARVPPSLDLVGAKLQPAWLREVVAHGASVRTAMRTRMPAFGTNLGDELADLFQEADGDALSPPAFERVADEREARQTGRELAGEKGLGCVACHTFLGRSATTLESVEMTTMTARLEESWFHHYLRDPQRFHPQTIMPSFWPGGKSVRPEILGGDAGRQIDALWQFLSRGREAGEPAGIRREPLPILVEEDEAVMLRRSYPGIGKRGIGVGYPGGLNLSFDAGRGNLASIWRGEFAEASGVWRGQGSGNVRPLGADLHAFPQGPGFARLAAPDAPWPDGEPVKAEGFQFLGYVLDERRRPTFRYRFHDVLVEDRFVDNPGPGNESGAFFRRTITVSRSDAPGARVAAPPGALHLRAAGGGRIEPAATGMAGDWRLDGKISLELPEDAFVRPAAGGDDRELLVPVAVPSTFEILYRWLP